MRRYLVMGMVAVALWLGQGGGFAQSSLVQPTVDTPFINCNANAPSPYTEIPAYGVNIKSGSKVFYCMDSTEPLSTTVVHTQIIVDADAGTPFDAICIVSGPTLYLCEGLLPGEVLRKLWVTGQHVMTLPNVGGMGMIITGCPEMIITTSPWSVNAANVVPVHAALGQRNQMSSASFAATIAFLHANGYATPVAQRTQPQLDAGDGKGGYWQIAAECKGSPQ